MKATWLIVFVLSLAGLMSVLARNGVSSHWLKTMGFHLFLAVVMLYGWQWVEPFTHVHLPINWFTVLIVSVLGLPGLIMLTVLKWALF